MLLGDENCQALFGVSSLGHGRYLSPGLKSNWECRLRVTINGSVEKPQMRSILVTCKLLAALILLELRLYGSGTMFAMYDDRR